MDTEYIVGKLNKDKSSYDLKGWEEVPDEDLWEDGEISKHRLRYKLYNNVILTGDWKIIRRKNG
jgi:hypothetical protein